MGGKIHPRTNLAATNHAQKHTGDPNIELRPASTLERALVRAVTLDNEAVADAVVALDSKGNEFLLGIYDDQRTAHFNYQSAMSTSIGLVPLVGPYVAAGIALKDIGVAGVPLALAKIHGEPASAEQRAVLRMGLKHLTLATASIATHGAAHYVMAAVELWGAGKDFFDSTRVWRELPRALWNALKTLFSVREHGEEVPYESLRVVVVKQLKTVTEPLEKGSGNPELTAGPPAE